MEPSTDGGAELLIDDSTCGCCCCPWRRRKASGLRDPFLTAGEHCATGLPQQEEPSLGPDAKRVGQVVREIVSTERDYVSDLELLATHFMPLLRSQLATSDRWGFRVDAQADELPDCSALLRMHTEVLVQLVASGESASGIATAFAGMAPYLRIYSSYCSAYDRALQAADELRRNQGVLALSALEAKHGQRVDSLLIKPVQRLCKYPLFFRELCALLPESRAEYPQLRLLADEMAAINVEVNGKVLTDPLCACIVLYYVAIYFLLAILLSGYTCSGHAKVRDVDEAARLLLLHQRLGGKLEDLLAPTRRLYLMADVRLAAGRAAPRRAVVAVLSDALLLARPRKALGVRPFAAASPRSATRAKVRATCPLHLHGVLPLEACTLTLVPAAPAELFLLCSSPPLSHRCVCASVAAAAELIAAFGAALAALASTRAGAERRASLVPPGEAGAAGTEAAAADAVPQGAGVVGAAASSIARRLSLSQDQDPARAARAARRTSLRRFSLRALRAGAPGSASGVDGVGGASGAGGAGGSGGTAPDCGPQLSGAPAPAAEAFGLFGLVRSTGDASPRPKPKAAPPKQPPPPPPHPTTTTTTTTMPRSRAPLPTSRPNPEPGQLVR